MDGKKMNVLCLDLEMNQPSGKTIQIGAVVFKARTGELLDALSVYINPGEPISDKIIELCGITDDIIRENGTDLLTGYKMLEELQKKHRCFMNPIVWGAGRSNDSLHLFDEVKPLLPAGEQNFMGFRVNDCKGLFQALAMYKNVGVRAGVFKACTKFGIGFDETYGKPHNALADAHNTMRLWYHMMSQFGPSFTMKLKAVKIDPTQRTESDQ